MPCGPVQTAAQAIDRELELDTGLVAEGADGVRMIGSPIWIGGSRPAPGSPAPSLGEHTDEVLAELGFGEPEIHTLRREGVVS